MHKYITIIAALLAATSMWAQGTDTTKAITIEQLKYKQQPGLALAASKIYFSDKRYAISGFGEFNYVPVQTNVNRDVGDLELYYSGLYRYATFFGYKLSDKFIWNSEFQIEFLNDRLEESHYEIVLEAFVDYLFKDYLKARFGFFPLTIGYVNNNDEPVMFYSVNRSEVERLITPSTWIELGAMLYGEITPELSYAFAISQGLNARSYVGSTWIRQGREIRLGPVRSVSFNPQLVFTPNDHLTLSASAYYGNSDQGARIPTDDGGSKGFKATINLITAYAKYDLDRWRFVWVGTSGQLGDTRDIFEFTFLNQDGNGQVLGSSVYGTLIEAGYDLLPSLRRGKQPSGKNTWLVRPAEMKVPVFARYERLNTHHKVADPLRERDFAANDLDILTIGVNLNTRENVVFKTNYQYRRNRFPGDLNPIKHIVEFGVGFIY